MSRSDLILYVAAVGCCLLGAAGVPRVHWGYLAAACLIATYVF
jgi:hypothetical protein